MSIFLDSLKDDLREAIERTGVTVTLEAKQKVFERGDPGEAFYIIEKGSVIVHDGDLVLNELGEGEAFGEIAGLGGMERTATVTAAEDLTLLRVEREVFLAIAPPADMKAPGERDTPGGFGIFLMRSVMDEIIYRPLEIGNELTMIKRRVVDLPNSQLQNQSPE